MIIDTSSGKLKMLHKAILPNGKKEIFMSSVTYKYGTAYLDIFGTWHLGSRHKTQASAIASAKKQNRSPVWADKPVQVIEIYI
jgi:hypothetical protein